MSSDHSSIGPSDSRLPSNQVQTVDPEDDHQFGVSVVNIVYKVCKVGSIFGIDHEQTEEAIEEFMDFFRKALAQRAEDAVSFQIRGEFALVDETQLRLPFQTQKRLRELRGIFDEVHLQGVTFRRGLTNGDLERLLEALHRATESEDEETLEGIDVPHVELHHGRPTRPIAEALGDVTREMYVSHMYVRWLVKVRHGQRLLREDEDAEVSVRSLERIMQNVAKQFREGDFTILTLPPLEILSPSLATHSVHASMYAMLICDRLGVPARMTSYLGAAVVAQDFDRIRGVSVRRQGGSREVSLEKLFAANRRDLASILDELDGRAVSAIRAVSLYERALPWNETLEAPFYRRERHVHVVNRIVDLARQYDLLAQGLKGDRDRSPKRALDLVRRRAGDDFDTALVQLFTSVMGAYPVGTRLELNTGDRAVVVRPPAPSNAPTRPSVRLIEREGRPTVDLARSKYEQVEIVDVIEPDEQGSDDDVFILT